MRAYTAIIPAVLLWTLLPAVGIAGVHLYTGTMQVIAASGKACQGQLGSHDVTLMLRQEQGSDVISGIFEGQGITAGQFSGSNAARLDVRYPYQDEFKAAGHVISITGDGATLTAELRDRHLEATYEDCNFDQARMHLVRSGDGDAESRYRAATALFDAQLTRAQAFALARVGRYDEALPLYEKALALAESLPGDVAARWAPYIIGLANAYVKLGRADDFNKLYDRHISQIKDDAVRGLFSSHRVRFLLLAGRTSLQREEYQDALKAFQKAYSLEPQSREAMAAIMMTYLRSGRPDSAISFLEESLKTMAGEAGSQDLSMALANLYLQRAKKSEKDGKIAEAEADLAKADSLDPDSVQYLIALARLRHKSGSLAEAENLLQQGLDRFQHESSRQEIIAARDRMRQTDMILKKLRKAGG